MSCLSLLHDLVQWYGIHPHFSCGRAFCLFSARNRKYVFTDWADLDFCPRFFVRRFVGKMGERRMALWGIAIGTLAFLMISNSFNETTFFIALFLMSCGVALISPTLTSLTSLHSSESDQGFHLGVFRSSGSMARACGPLLAGLVYFTCGSVTAYTFGAIILLVPFLILRKVPQPSPSTSEKTA